MAVFLCLIGGTGQVWGASGRPYLKAYSKTPAQGLVYASSSNSSTPTYRQYSPAGSELAGGGATMTTTAPSNTDEYLKGSSSGGSNFYCWAKPARGYMFSTWNGYQDGKTASASTSSRNDFNYATKGTWVGTADKIEQNSGGNASTFCSVYPTFAAATAYDVTYKAPAANQYNVKYSYELVRQRSDGEYEFYTATEDFDVVKGGSDKTPTGNVSPANTKSYEADKITLTVANSITNFAGWKENGVLLSTNKSYTYKPTGAAGARLIEAEFKWCVLGEATGDLGPSVKVLGSNNYTVTVPVTDVISSWNTSDFTVTFTLTDGAAAITKGSVAYAADPLDGSKGTLTIPFTYNPTIWGGSTYHVTVTPVFGESIEFDIEASADEPIGFEARIFANGANPLTDAALYTGNLVDMVAQANTMDSKPLLQLTQDKTIAAPLTFTKSMTFDINGKTLTSTGTSAISIASADVTVTDDSYSHNGVITVSANSASVVSVATFTAAGKLTLNGGTLSATNANGAAYGIDVKNGSVFSQTGGHLTVTSPSDARGVNVATGSDYATITGGDITVSAPTNAYGVWSAGQTNIANSTMDAKATTGAKAYGLYINGGVTTCDNVTLTADAKTTNAYGVLVNAGKLNYTAGSIAATAVTSDAYGVQIASGATANIQTRASITASAGSVVRGINNLGTATILNANVNVSATSDATAVNSPTSAVSTTIEDGTYIATVTNGGAVYGLHHQYGALDVDGGTFKGIAETGNSAWGARMAVNGSMKNATIWGETKGGTTAYGFVAGVAGKTITLVNCNVTGQSKTSTAYAIYSRANVTATDCQLAAYALGGSTACALNAESGTNTLNNCGADVYAYTTTAYAVNQSAGTLTVNNGSYAVTAEQIGAASGANTSLYGVKSAASCVATINGASFNVKATNNSASQNVYGVYTQGTLTSDAATYVVSARANVYGVAGLGTGSTLNLSNNHITANATNGTKGYGIYAEKNVSVDGDDVKATSLTTDTYAMYFTSAAVGSVLGGKFDAMGNNTSDFGGINAAATAANVKLRGGYYRTITNLAKYPASGFHVFNLDMTHPEFANGYRYVVAETNPCTAACMIVGGSAYPTLEAAIQYVNDNASVNNTIVMLQNYTLPAGDYSLPAKATLLVPYNGEQTTIAGASPIKRSTAGVLSEHLRLTLAAGANLNVNGKIEVGGELYCKETGLTGHVNSTYGRIHMEEGSHIQLNDGAFLYAWGFITGQGEIKVKNNAEVHEMFQIGDMKALAALVQAYLDNSEHFFPISQYFIQNIEAPTTYYYNSRLIAAMSIYAGLKYSGDDNVKIVGTSNSMFLVTDPDESSWVRKSYDPKTDKLVWEISSDASVGSLSLSFDNPLSIGPKKVAINSANYRLPIASNMKIHALDGNLNFTQETELLPGSEVEINKTASMTVVSGESMYVWDRDQWSFAYATTNYSPSWTNGTKPTRTNPDAALNVHGKIIANAGFYTTAKNTEATDGANIFSTNEDAGSIDWMVAAPANGTIKVITTASGASKTSKDINVTAAKLKNADGTYTTTTGTAKDHSHVYMDGMWQETYVDGCFKVIGTTYYANPAEYVALQNGKTANADHTYTTVGGKILILQNDCQWWEVEATATPGVFECKKAGYEGFYSYNATAGEWQLVKRNVTFYLNEEKTSSKVVSVNYMGVPDQSVIASNPSKATTAEATYTFYGWKSSVTDNEYAWTATLEAAENDMFYTPVFTETARNYTITFNDADNNGAVKVEAAYGSRPQVVPSKPATAQYTYTFKDFTDGSGNHYLTCAELPVVTGAATYTANWTGITNVYTVVFKDGEQTLQTKIDQPYGTATAFAGVLPSKAADDEFEYAFDGWVSSQNGTKYANGSTPTVSGDVTYTAHYATTARYFITFANYDGTVLQREATTAGAHPVYNGTPRRDADRDGYFRFDGWMDGDGTTYNVGDELPAVSKKQTYTAQWTYVTTRYTVKFVNFDGNNGEWEGQFGEGETPSYDGATPLAKVSDKPAQYYYEFAGWTPAIAPVTGPATYTAQWSEAILVKYTITFVYDGYGNTIKKEYAYGATPAYDTSAGDPTPRKDDEGEYSYTFNGWKEAFAPVTGDATYTADFNQTQHQYTITFVKDNGEPNVEQHLYKNVTPVIANPTKETDAEWSYTFAGWNPAISPVLYDATYTAQWNQTGVPYNVTFVDEDGTTVLKATEPVAHGTQPTAPANPSKAPVGETFYKFESWTMSTDGGASYEGSYTAATIPAVGTNNVIYKAVYTTIVPEALVIVGEDITPYESFATALSNVTNGATLKLMKNISRGSTATSLNKNMTLDLNGKTLSSNFGKVSVDANVILVDGLGGGKIKSEQSQNAASRVVTLNGNSGANSLTIESGAIEAINTNTSSSNATVCVYVTSGGILTINGGLLTAQSGRVAYAIHTYTSSGVVTINGGELKATGGSSRTAYAVYRQSINTLTVTGGKFYTATSSTKAAFSASTTVSGGFYTQNTNVTKATNYEVHQIGNTETEYAAEYAAGYRYVVRKNRYDIIFKNGDVELQNTKVEHGSMPEYVGETPQKDGYAFDGWDNEIVAATANATYTAQWKVNQYTVSWDANGGVLSGDYTSGSVDYGTTIEAPTATKVGYNFTGWSPEVPLTVTDNLSFTANWTEVPLTADIVADDEVVEISENTKVNNLTISETGSVTITDDAAVTVVNNLLLEATPDNNLGAVLSGNIQVQGDAFIDINMNGSGTMNKKFYYSFAVPFNVNLDGGVFRMENGKAVSAKPNTEFRVWTYSESARATSTENAWIQQTSGTLVPGVFYLLQVATNNTNTYRFKWNGNGKLNNHGDIENLSCTSKGSDESAASGWHGVANNGLGYAKLSGNFTYVQVLNSEKNIFDGKRASVFPVAIGNPVFVQMSAAGNISMTASAPAVVAAPRRAQAYSENDIMTLQITKNGASKYDDQIFFSASEDALDEYEVGKDLSKMFMGTAKAAQLWINAYDSKLLANEAPMVDGGAEFSLTLSAPAAGNYELGLKDVPADVEVYLLQNNVPVVNLSLAQYYMLTLTQGTTDEYSLSVRRAKHVATDINGINDADHLAEKILYDGKLYIVSGEHVFDAQGKLMK